MVMGWLFDPLTNHLFGRNTKSLRGKALMFDCMSQGASID